MTWGEVESHSSADRVDITLHEHGERCIEWRTPDLESNRAQSRGSYRFSAAFDQQIEPTSTIHGKLVMIFNGALSELVGVHRHVDGGARRDDGIRRTVQTQIHLGFTFNMEGIRYQDIRVVPDPAKDPDGEPEKRIFDHVVPDHQTIAHLTDNLSREDYYVKSVVENPPQAGRQAGVLNRFWDIAGRRYSGVHPIDFHIIVTGEEAEPDASMPDRTIVRLTVRGSYATTEMEQRIVHEHALIWQRIKNSLEAASEFHDQVPRSEDEPINAANVEVGRLRDVAVSLLDYLETGRQDGSIPAEVARELVDRIEVDVGLHRNGSDD
jgi:hypothetical protein